MEIEKDLVIVTFTDVKTGEEFSLESERGYINDLEYRDNFLADWLWNPRIRTVERNITQSLK